MNFVSQLSNVFQCSESSESSCDAPELIAQIGVHAEEEECIGVNIMFKFQPGPGQVICYD